MLAMLSAGISVDRYVAFEIDKYAVQTSSHNFPMIEHRGDVFKADFTEFEGFDVVLAGFPCTKFSVAQKKERETEPYSGEGWLLFEQAWRAVCEAKPKYFLFENNKSMAKAVQSEISKIVGFEPVCASLIEQPFGRKKLEDGSYDRRFEARTDNKSNALVATHQQQFGMVATPVCVAERGRYGSDGIEQHYEAREDGKTNVLTTVQKDNQCCEPVRVGCFPSPDGTLKNSQAMRLYDPEGKSVNLTAQGGGLGAKTGLYTLEVPIYAEATEWDENGKPIKSKSYADGKEYPVYEVKDGQITIKDKTYPIKLKDGFYIIRKLTVLECMRLQTVPEWYEFPVSDSQAYKMLGNGWTVDVIVHILSFIREE